MWIGLYAVAALVVGMALFVLAEFQREPGTPAPQRPGTCAMVAGLLWPVLLIAAAQCALLLVVRSRLRRAVVLAGEGPTRIANPVG